MNVRPLQAEGLKMVLIERNNIGAERLSQRKYQSATRLLQETLSFSKNAIRTAAASPAGAATTTMSPCRDEVTCSGIISSTDETSNTFQHRHEDSLSSLHDEGTANGQHHYNLGSSHTTGAVDSSINVPPTGGSATVSLSNSNEKQDEESSTSGGGAVTFLPIPSRSPLVATIASLPTQQLFSTGTNPPLSQDIADSSSSSTRFLGAAVISRRCSNFVTFNQVLATIIYNVALAISLQELDSRTGTQGTSACFKNNEESTATTTMMTATTTLPPNASKARIIQALELNMLCTSTLLVADDEEEQDYLSSTSTTSTGMCCLSNIMFLASLYNTSRIHKTVGDVQAMRHSSEQMMSFFIMLREQHQEMIEDEEDVLPEERRHRPPRVDSHAMISRYDIMNAIQIIAAELILKASNVAPSA